jgi:hypothetical protein
MITDPTLRSDWVAQRASWVHHVLEREPALAQTPLMPFLLALLAAENESGTLPAERATILHKVIENVVRRWEVRQRRQGEVQIGTLVGEAATAALFQSFSLIGWQQVADERFDKARCESMLAVAFGLHWGLPPGHATVAAQEALHFWMRLAFSYSKATRRLTQPALHSSPKLAPHGISYHSKGSNSRPELPS